MVRLVLLPAQHGMEVAVDLAGHSSGRGAWVHGRTQCLERAAARGLGRSARAPISLQQATLCGAIVTAAERRVAGLLHAARRSGKLAAGTSAVERALEQGQARLLLVAGDAAAAAGTQAVQRALASGFAFVWGTKSSLGAIARGAGAEVGVMAIVSEPIAEAVRRTVALGHACAAHLYRRGADGAGAAAPSLDVVRLPSPDQRLRRRRPVSN